MKLFSNTITTLENGLQFATQRQKAISQNIANVDTPNYKAKDVSFKQILKSEIGKSFGAYRTDNRHFEFNNTMQGTTFVNRKNVSYNHNGNSVDLDKEMADLAENQIYYNALVERMNGKFSSLQNVIRGGK